MYQSIYRSCNKAIYRNSVHQQKMRTKMFTEINNGEFKNRIAEKFITRYKTESRN